MQVRSTKGTYLIDEAMNQETTLLISIIVAVLNGKFILQQCIDSVGQHPLKIKIRKGVGDA